MSPGQGHLVCAEGTEKYKPMQNTFLDYYKIVLDKVSFDHQLFMKEYRKALGLLSAREADDLHSWLDSKGLLPLHRRPAPYDGWQRPESGAFAPRTQA